MRQRQLDEVRKRSKVFDEVAEKARLQRRAIDGEAATDHAIRATKGELGFESLPDPRAGFAQEAIILSELRPAYLIRNDEIVLENAPKGDPELVQLIETHKLNLEKLCKSAGRVDLFNHWSLPYGGSGWLIDENLVVTNRHVARLFAQQTWSGYEFQAGRFGQRMEARFDAMHQIDTTGRRRAEVIEVLFIAGDREPDIAFLRVELIDDVEPLQVATKRGEPGLPVAVVGYPAEDGDRNDPALMRELFGDTFNVKRFSPGFLTDRDSDEIVLTSDYTSLGGNSGSAVLDLEAGNVIGLHFAGAFREANLLVAGDIVSAARRRLGVSVQVPLPEAELAGETEAPTSSPSQFSGRPGYDPHFLGASVHAVPLPHLGAWAEDIAPVSDDDDNVLKYRHFSVIQSKSRRLPLLTAVNISGDQTFRLKRTGSWRLDGRLALEHQIGNELYKRNPFDRGHMVRRRDPGWGETREQAQEAEIDTFHYTNSVPQHKDLNQRDWVGLEDYILEAAETKDFKVSVFTGPVFRETDKTLRHQPGAEDVPIPEEFWKVAVMVNSATNQLSATGYVLSHGPMIRDLVEAVFILGEYETYQVPIAKIEAETGLDFGRLRDFDPLGSDVPREAIFDRVARRVAGPESLTL